MNRLAAVALIALALSPLPAVAQNAGDTAVLSHGTEIAIGPTENALIRGGDIVTRADVGKVVEFTGGHFSDSAARIEAKLADMQRQAYDKGIPWKDRRNIKLDLKSSELGDRAAQNAKRADWIGKAGNLLKAMDVTSTVAKTAGYLWEGDTTGAKTVIVDDVIKKTLEFGGGAVGTLGGPVGGIVGTTLATEFHDRNIKPGLERVEADERQREYDERYRSTPWMQKIEVLGTDGRMRVLAEDQYVDRTTGLVQVRSPAEQAAHVAELRKVWQDRKALESLDERLRLGEIDHAHYERMIRDYAAREPYRQWNPDEAEARLEAADRMREEAERMAVEQDQETGFRAQRVTASFLVEESYGSTQANFEFWNVGAREPGREGVTVSFVLITAVTGEVERHTATGTFTGGPDGVMYLDVPDEGLVTCYLSMGRTLTCEGVTATVANPSAFDGWPG